MNNWTFSRLAIYAAGGIAGLLALMGYADFDRETWALDIKPFNLREALLSGTAMIGNAMAGLAVIRGWGKK